MLHAQRAGQNLGHDGIVDETGGQRASSCLSGWRNIGLRQTSKLEKSRVARSGAPARLWRQRARGVRVEFTLELRRQSDRREVLEFHIIGNPESATNRSLAISPWVIRKTHAGSEVVLVRLGVAEGDDSRRVGNRVQGLSARSDRIRPVFVPQAQVHA